MYSRLYCSTAVLSTSYLVNHQPGHAPGRQGSVRQRVDQVVDAELVCFVRFVDWAKPLRGEFPIVRDVGVEVDHHHQTLLGIIVLEDSAEQRRPAIVELPHDVERRNVDEK